MMKITNDEILTVIEKENLPNSVKDVFYYFISDAITDCQNQINKKDRENDLHHALDAAVIATTTQKIINNIEIKDKVGLCLDTCHVFDAGYDIKSNLESVLEEFDKEIEENEDNYIIKQNKDASVEDIEVALEVSPAIMDVASPDDMAEVFSFSEKSMQKSIK